MGGSVDRYTYSCPNGCQAFHVRGIDRYRHLLALARPSCPTHPGRALGGWAISTEDERRGLIVRLVPMNRSFVGAGDRMGTRQASQLQPEDLEDIVREAVARARRQLDAADEDRGS